MALHTDLPIYRTGVRLLALGYPARNDAERRLRRPWRGFERQTIQHPHFGPDPVEVFAIYVAPTT